MGIMSVRARAAAILRATLARTMSGSLWLLANTGIAVGQSQPVVPAGYTVETAASNVFGVTTLAFLDEHEVLALLQHGDVYHIDLDQPGSNVQVLHVPLTTSGEMGLLGIAKHPQFEKNQRIYLYYTSYQNPKGNLVSYSWDGVALVEPEHILSLPVTTSQIHNGGVILFGPDEKLYLVAGDQATSSQTSNTATSPFIENAIILRLNDDGSAPLDNPLNTPGWEKVYAYGVRNSFGLAFDPLTGDLWDTENGPDSYDEVNRIIPGMNSGWVDIMGPDSRDPQGVADLVMIPGATYVDPAFSWLFTVAPTGIRFLDSCRWPASMRYDCFVGETNNGRLYKFDPNPSRAGFVLSGSLSDLVADTPAERAQVVWASGFGSLTDIQLGPDGYLYIADYFFGDIYRIRPINPMGDLNLDGNVTMDDVPPFTSALLSETISPQELAVADFDGDGTVTGMDIPCFVTSLQMPN